MSGLDFEYAIKKDVRNNPIVREVDEGPPLRVSYRLTAAGAALEPSLKELGQWATQHLPGDSPC